MKPSVLITGASSGIGRHLATTMARAGWRVLAVGRDENALQQLATDGSGSEIHFKAIDLKVSKAREALCAWLPQVVPHGVDVLVHAAGAASLGPLPELPEEEFDESFAVQVLALHALVRSQWPRWAANRQRWNGGPQVIILGSGVAYRGLPEVAPYCASKAAQLSYSESLRVELKTLGGVVTLFSPGLVNSPFSSRAKIFGSLKKDFSIGQKADVGKTVERIMKAIDRRPARMEFSSRGRLVRILNAIFPSLVDWLVSRSYQT